jgi:hypothetical protein
MLDWRELFMLDAMHTRQLHERIALAGIPIAGVALLIDEEEQPVIRIDFLEEATTELRSLAEQIARDFQPAPDPDWLKLAIEFQFPGNPLYASVLGKVAAADFVAQDHWQNFKLLLSTPSLQSVEALAAAIAHLDRLLSDAGHGLSNQDKASWNRLMGECSFPIECQLR